MREQDLPTADEILGKALDELDEARRHLSEAASWLRSDWRPIGTPLTAEQAAWRDAMRKAIEEGKQLIDEAKGAGR